MKFKILVESVGDGLDPWWENYDKPTDNAQECAEEIIRYWNGTLRPHEKPRKLLEVQVIDDRIHTDTHTWRKVNSATVYQAGKYFDKYQCEVCKVTGKRHGLGDSIAIDSRFRAKKYQKCSTAVAKT